MIGTALLGWAMLSMPKMFTPELTQHSEDMLRFLGEHYGSLVVAQWFGSAFGIFVGVVFGLLLFSAVNTAVVALIGVIYMMAQDGEMPKQLARLNRHGVPRIPLFVAVVIPIVVLAVTPKFEGLAGLYAIGVVGAIAVNLGSCTFNKKLDLTWYQRLLMGVTFLILDRGRVDDREDETGRALLRHLRPRDRSRLARLLAQTLRAQDRHDDEGSRGDGRAQSSRDDEAEAGGRAKNHGRGARD